MRLFRRRSNKRSEKPSMIATAVRKFSFLTATSIAAVFGFIWLIQYQLTPSFYADVYEHVEMSFRSHESELVTAFLQNDSNKALRISQDPDFLPDAEKKILSKAEMAIVTENCAGVADTLPWGHVCREEKILTGLIPIRSADQLLGGLQFSIPARLSDWTPYKRLHYAIVISSILMIVLTFLFLIRFLRSTLIPVRCAIRDLETADDTAALRKAGAELPFQELVGLATKLVKRSDELYQMRNQLDEAKRREQLSSVATQVAHDLRSPVLALSALSREVENLSKEDLIRSIETSAKRIDQISKDILERYEITTVKSYGGYTFIYPVLQTVIAEASLVSPNIQINLDIDDRDLSLGLRIPEVDLGRIFANILSNATAAIQRKSSGTIDVSVRNTSGLTEFIFKDSGQGMTSEVLSTVLNKGGTFNTPHGHGLGLSFVKSAIAQFQGNIRIESDWMKGTTVYLIFPSTIPPSWLATEINLNPNSKLAVIDDDSSILEAWKRKIGKQVSVFKKPENLIVADVYIVDQDIRGHPETGLQYIEKNSIAPKAILSTAHYSDERIQKEVERIGCRFLPKFLIHKFELNFGKILNQAPLDLVLIDDDSVTRQSWELMAKVRGKKMQSFASYSVFNSAKVASTVPIYIDKNLSNGISGIDVLRKLSLSGFKKLHLISGDDVTHSESKEFPLA